MPGQSGEWTATARLLRRAGFGASGPQIDAVVNQGWPAYLGTILAADPDADPGARATPLPVFETPLRPARTAGTEAGKRYNQTLTAQMRQLSHWWITRMVAVHDPTHEKMTLLWHNHFATSAAKVRVAASMAAQNQTLRSHKLGDFRTLAFAMLTDPAMLRWLDATTNTAGSPNENLAREFMELFALGHGYTESDVRAGARALTGWVVSADGTPLFIPGRHDGTTKTLFGATAAFDAAGFCDAVLAQPAAPAYLASKLWGQLATDTAPSAAVLARLVDAYGPGRDLQALTTAILTEPEFTAAAPGLVNTPVEWLVGVIRALRVPMTADHLRATETTLKALGQRPFYPPDVAGWPRGPRWLSTASATVRFGAAAALATAGDLSTVEQAGTGERLDAAGYLLGVGDWTDRSAAALRPLAGDPPRLVAAAVNTPEYLTS